MRPPRGGSSRNRGGLVTMVIILTAVVGFIGWSYREVNTRYFYAINDLKRLSDLFQLRNQIVASILPPSQRSAMTARLQKRALGVSEISPYDVPARIHGLEDWDQELRRVSSRVMRDVRQQEGSESQRERFAESLEKERSLRASYNNYCESYNREVESLISHLIAVLTGLPDRLPDIDQV